MPLSQYLIKAEVYYNVRKHAVEFKLPDGSESFAALKETLNGLLPDYENRRVTKIEFREDYIGTDCWV